MVNIRRVSTWWLQAICLTATIIAGCGTAVEKETATVIVEGVDRYHTADPLFECVRVALNQRGEPYSTAYIGGISGAAFRIAGICPCAPTSNYAMKTEELVRLFGYETECQAGLGDFAEADSVARDSATAPVIARIRREIDEGRAAIVWHAFTHYEFDVVSGYDDSTGEFIGYGTYAGGDEPARAPEGRFVTAGGMNPGAVAIFIGEKTGEFDTRGAEVAALREAVRHAHSEENVDQRDGTGENWRMLQGIACYDRWVDSFRLTPDRTPGNGDCYCIGMYRHTRRDAAGFCREIASSYPDASAHLLAAAEHFDTEAAALNECFEMLFPGWKLPEEADPEANARAADLIGRARDSYTQGIAEIENALATM